MKRPAALVWLGAAGWAAAAAGDEPFLGPRGIRDEFLLAQGRLSLPAMSADALPRGSSRLRLAIDWGNDLARDQSGVGEQPTDRRYLVDGEHRTLDVEWRLGLGRGREVGVRAPLRWRGGGVLDGVIDAFHGLTKKLGLPDNDRSFLHRDLLRIEARDRSGRRLTESEAGTGLGNLELTGRFGRTSSDGRKRAALVLRGMLPSGTGPFSANGIGLAAQLVGGRRNGAWELASGLGASYESESERRGFRFASTRVQGFFAAEWRLAERFALLGETTAASRLVTNVPRFPGLAWYLGLGGRLRFGRRFSIEGGFTENIASQQGTTDIGFQLALLRR